jgi:hypothetical protein
MVSPQVGQLQLSVTQGLFGRHVSLQAHRGSATSRELTCGAQKTFREGGSDAEGGGGGGGGSSGAGASQPEPPTPFDLENSPVLLQHCMERARRAVKKIEGQNFVPLEEASGCRSSGCPACPGRLRFV